MMNVSKTEIGVKLKISNDIEIPLVKGNNIIHYKDIYLNSGSKEENTILFLLKCSSSKSILLRTFSAVPLMIKANNVSTSFMNDSLVDLKDVFKMKIIPLINKKTECIMFENYEIHKVLSDIDKETEKGKKYVKCLDGIINYYEKKSLSASYADTNSKNEVSSRNSSNEEKFETLFHDPIKTTENSKNSKRRKCLRLSLSKPKKKKLSLSFQSNPQPQQLQLQIQTKQKDLQNKDILMSSLSEQKKQKSKKIIKKRKNSYEDLKPIIQTKYIKRKRQRTRTISEIPPSKNKEPKDSLQNKCPICLEQIKNKSSLNTCEHEFCKDCINHWAQFSSQCPCCKEDFSKIIYYDSKNSSPTEQKVKKKHFQPDEEEIEQWYTNCDDKCLICGKSDNTSELLVCDRCDFRICHTTCVGLSSIPDGDWICPECIKKEQRKRKKRIKKALPKPSLTIQLRSRRNRFKPQARYTYFLRNK